MSKQFIETISPQLLFQILPFLRIFILAIIYFPYNVCFQYVGWQQIQTAIVHDRENTECRFLTRCRNNNQTAFLNQECQKIKDICVVVMKFISNAIQEDSRISNYIFLGIIFAIMIYGQTI